MIDVRLDILRNLRALRNDAQERFEKEFALQFPPSYPIDWERGGFRQHGTVVRYVYKERLLVRNCYTGAEYHIYMSDVLR